MDNSEKCGESDNTVPVTRQEAELLKMFKDLIKQPERLKQLLDLDARGTESQTLIPRQGTPYEWSSNSHSSYYNEKHALQLKPILDTMMGDKEPILFRLEDFPDKNKKTIQAQINASWLYLMDKLDPDGLYRQMRGQVEVSRTHPAGVSVYYKDNNPEKETTLVAHKLIKAELKQWRGELDEFLEKAKPGERRKIPGLALTPEQTVDLNIELGQIAGIVFVVKSTEIIIGKNPEKSV